MKPEDLNKHKTVYWVHCDFWAKINLEKDDQGLIVISIELYKNISIEDMPDGRFDPDFSSHIALGLTTGSGKFFDALYSEKSDAIEALQENRRRLCELHLNGNDYSSYRYIHNRYQKSIEKLSMS